MSVTNWGKEKCIFVATAWAVRKTQCKYFHSKPEQLCGAWVGGFENWFVPLLSYRNRVEACGYRAYIPYSTDTSVFFSIIFYLPPPAQLAHPFLRFWRKVSSWNSVNLNNPLPPCEACLVYVKFLLIMWVILFFLKKTNLSWEEVDFGEWTQGGKTLSKDRRESAVNAEALRMP